jgi:ParB-like chromosome segregation protein Spo0J
MRCAIAHGSGSNGFVVSRNLNPKLVSVSLLAPLGRETRKHPPAQIRKLAESLNRLGFVLPVLVDRRNRVVAGWGLVLAARRLGLAEVPAVIISDLGEAELRLLRLALNRLAEDSSWDQNVLKLEFNDVLEISNNIELAASGFEMGEIDSLLSYGIDEEDALPVVDEASPPIAKPGDLWRLGDHGLLCGDALAEESHARLMGSDRAEMIFTDPPWNIPIEDNVSGLGAVKHKDFAMACGEMSPAGLCHVADERA